MDSVDSCSTVGTESLASGSQACQSQSSELIVWEIEVPKVFCWRSMGTAAKQCRWAYGRQVFMSDIALSKTSMMFVTQDGEGFSGEWLGQCKKAGDKKDGLELSSHLESGAVYERIRLEKLHYVHRAVSITMDSKGRNFGLLQADPKTRYR
ncbi:putative inhibitor of Bruton tyrosine kinase [Triplophysa rosa]|uniref:Inhibitor of Bruton tyrosine kinase n=1 Tax=Triplophysa rosa TaxID=992332 RepID=A0A9W7WPV5_TRIRA|nr:putative inhibitor of Bruton tyrosine kinase [Triplophysa rosa]